MEKKLPHDQLRIIDFDLMSDKRKDLMSILSSLRLEDVKSPQDSLLLTSKVKQRLLLKKIKLDDVQVSDHKEVERQMPTDQFNSSPFNYKTFVFTLSATFSGSPELLNYRPNGYSYSGNARHIYQPNEAGTMQLNVEHENFIKAEVISKANELLALTRTFIYENNSKVDNFNVQIEKLIEEEIKNKREQLINIYS